MANGMIFTRVQEYPVVAELNIKSVSTSILSPIWLY